MKTAAVVLAALGLACAGAATASERVTDLEYLKANRCKGLAEGLGSSDTAGVDALIKAQSRGRADPILQRADQELSRAKREASHADSKDRLAAELSGACVAYMGGGKEMASGR